jgi:uncharacterized membrane protein YhaH (DUF805 family)
MEAINPLVPAGYDIVWSVIAIVVFALMVTALVLLARNARRLTATQALVWTLLIIFVPVIGPVSWMAIGRRTADSAGGRRP